MKIFKGTQGPWSRDGYEFFNSDGANIFDLAYGSHTGIKEDEANCNLIAAAPELLEALRQLRDYAEDVLAVSLADCDPEHPMMLATSAINKALGE